MVITERLASLAALLAKYPQGAAGYYITADTGDVYWWDKGASAWVSLGKIQGPQGPTGAGIDSIDRTSGTGLAGSLDVYTVTLSDGKQYTFTVQNGRDGNIADAEAANRLARQLLSETQAAASSAQTERQRAEAAADRAIDNAQAQVNAAEQEADRAGDAADRAGTEADRAASEADRAVDNAEAQIERATSEADRADSEADRAEVARKAIENLTVRAKTLLPGEEATVTKTLLEGFVNLLFGIPQGLQGAVGPRGEQGVEGPPGLQGPAGVVAEMMGLYAFHVNEAGHLILTYDDSTTPPSFELREDGHLYYIFEEAA